MQFRIRAAHSRFGAPRGFAGAAGGFRGAFIGACQSAEKTGETNVPNHPNGVFSFALLQVLRGPTGLTMPVAAISAAVTAAIQAAGYAQTPDLKGNPAIIERKWF
jgi:hypothetical protein